METICRGGRPVQGFALGTVLGVTSVEDLDKLIKNKDVELSAMGQQVAKSADPSMRQDWATLNQAYQIARAAGVKAVADGKTAFVPDSIASTPSVRAAYSAIIAALQPVPDQVTPGNKQDIANRLIATGWKPTYTLPYQTQSDADLTFYKDTQKPFDFLEWLEAHKKAFIVGGVALGGVVVLGVLSPYAKLLTTALPRRPAT